MGHALNLERPFRGKAAEHFLIFWSASEAVGSSFERVKQVL